MDNSINERLAKIETTLEEHSKLWEKQINKNDTQTELNTLIKMQIETSKEQAKTLQKFEATLNKVNENLTNLNNNQQQMKDDMNEIGNRVTDIEKNQVSQKIDPMTMFKSILTYAATGLGSIIIAFILYKFGLYPHK